MDLSKLPRLSNTPTPPPPEPSAAPAPFAAAIPGTAPASNIAADVWISLVVGLLLIFMGLNFPKYLMAKATGKPFHTGVNWQSGPNEGNEVEYFELEGGVAWTDAGMFLFGLAVVFDGIVLAAARLRPGRLSRAVVMFSVLITVIATVLNLYVAARLYRSGTVPLLSGLAIAFGGYILLTQWQQLAVSIARQEPKGN